MVKRGPHEAASNIRGAQCNEFLDRVPHAEGLAPAKKPRALHSTIASETQITANRSPMVLRS